VFRLDRASDLTGGIDYYMQLPDAINAARRCLRRDGQHRVVRSYPQEVELFRTGEADVVVVPPIDVKAAVAEVWGQAKLAGGTPGIAGRTAPPRSR
jgi:hypothetical protein